MFYFFEARHQLELQLQEHQKMAERLGYYGEDYKEDSVAQLLFIRSLISTSYYRDDAELFLQTAHEITAVYDTYRFIHFIDPEYTICTLFPRRRPRTEPYWL